MAVSISDLEQIRDYLIGQGTDVTELPEVTTDVDLITLPAVNTRTGGLVTLPMSTITQYINSLNTQNNQSALKALHAAAGAAKAQADLQAALNVLTNATTAANELISDISSAILGYLTPITQAQYDALVDAGTLENRPYLIYED